jgi:hypothetical protein
MKSAIEVLRFLKDTKITMLAKVAGWFEDNDIASCVRRPMIYADGVHAQLRSSHEFRNFFFDLKMRILCQWRERARSENFLA